MKRILTSLMLIASLMAIPVAAMAQGLPNTGEVTGFDNHYLDNHPQVAQQLSHHPALVDNPQFLATHPGLDQYLAYHPAIRTEFQQHPERFMSDEHYYERFENSVGARGLPNAGEVTGFDTHYLDKNPQVARQLGENPKLVDNPQYLATHPGLDQYLAHHPEIRTELQQHPERFMTDERYYQNFENRVGPGAIGRRLPNGGQVAGFDNHYLDENPQVARQLSQNPKLVDNPQYLATHPGLDTYLAHHPEVRADLQQHPYRFMSNERRYENSENRANAARLAALHRMKNLRHPNPPIQ
jgi:hypothetical protein